MVVAQNKPIKEKGQPGIIMGNVLESKSGRPIAFASIKLFRSGDSVKVVNMLADKNGAFEFENLAFGYYHLLISSVGFTLTQIDSIYLD